jgi:tetratricopeptide (TPR) repeat protein
MKSLLKTFLARGGMIFQGNTTSVKELEEALERMRAIVEKTYGEEHPCMAAVLVLRGRLEAARDRPRESRAPLEEALNILTDSFGDRHPDVARIFGYVAALNQSPSPAVYLRGVGEYEEAIAMAEEFFGDEHPEVARLWCGLAKLHVTAGKLPEARTALGRALDIQREALTPFHPAMAATYSAYAEVLDKLRPPAPDAAEQMRTRAQESMSMPSLFAATRLLTLRPSSRTSSHAR